ncbi:glycosyltransferase family 39 protein [bacterium]|nr:glycosyltransferase family 39 protein [candidate division CSSED10-310 bacterium]
MTGMHLARSSRATRGMILLVFCLFTLAVFLITGARITPTDDTFALQAFSPFMEFLIATSLDLRDIMLKNHKIVVLVLGAVTLTLYISWFLLRRRHRFPGLLHPALVCAVVAQYLLYNESYEFGFITYAAAFFLALTSVRLAGSAVPWDGWEPYKPRHIIGITAIFLTAFLMLFYRLDNWVPCCFRWAEPTFWDTYQFLHGKMDVWKHAVILGQSRETTSGECIFYLGMMVPLIKLFGFKIVTFRMLSVFGGILTLILSYVFFDRFHHRRIALLATAYLAVSGWLLLYARSETYVLFMVPLALFTFHMFSLGLFNDNLWSFAWAGLGIGLMPYFYAPIRIMPIILIGYLLVRGFLDVTWFNRRRPLGSRLIAALRRYLLPLLVIFTVFMIVISPQFTDIPQVKRMYFSGRGEHVINMTAHPHIMKMLLDDPTAEPPYPLDLRVRVGAGIIWSNIVSFFKNVFGLRPVPISFEYERLLVGGLALLGILGLGITVSRWREERHLLMLIWLLFGVSLAMGSNMISPARVLLAVIPIAFFIAVGVDGLWREWESVLGRAAVLAVPVFLTCFTALLLSEITTFYPKLGTYEFISKPHQASEKVKSYLPETEVIMVFPTWNFYAEGYLRVYLDEWFQTQDPNRLILYFMFSDYDELIADIGAGVYDKRGVVFMIENNQQEEIASKANDVLAAVRDRWSDKEARLVGDWMRIVDTR